MEKPYTCELFPSPRISLEGTEFLQCSDSKITSQIASILNGAYAFGITKAIQLISSGVTLEELNEEAKELYTKPVQ